MTKHLGDYLHDLEKYGYVRLECLFDEIERKTYKIDIYLENGQLYLDLNERDFPTFSNSYISTKDVDRCIMQKMIDYGYKDARKINNILRLFLIIYGISEYCTDKDYIFYRDLNFLLEYFYMTDAEKEDLSKEILELLENPQKYL